MSTSLLSPGAQSLAPSTGATSGRGAGLLSLLEGWIIRVNPRAGVDTNPTRRRRIRKVGDAVGAHALGELDHLCLASGISSLRRLTSRQVLLAGLRRLLGIRIIRVKPRVGVEVYPPRRVRIREVGVPVGAHALGELERSLLGTKAGIGGGFTAGDTRGPARRD